MSTETLEFKTEMKQLMDIIVHSLYSHKEIFLRELISNAADAVDKARFESLTNTSLLEDNADWKIKLTTDATAGTLTISDNGCGMSRESITENLGTIARSGTRAFMDKLKEAKDSNLPELIGQFGVGFYSSFMVADDVTVISRQAGDPSQGVKWTSDGHGSYSLEDVEKENRGTDVVLHLKDEEREFVDEWRLRQLVKKFSDFIEHPIVMDVEREVEVESDSDDEGDEAKEEKEEKKEKKEKKEKEKKKVIEEETLNSQQAIWLRPKDEVTEEQHQEFYKHISHDFQKPAKTIHYAAEGVIEFRALLYLPSQKPFDMFMPDSKTGLHLYIKRVFIMDDCDELMPEYLRFVKGVVDASDLPLNVSREILQQNPQLEKIRKNLSGKTLDTIAEMKEKQYDDYVSFYGEFGPVIKEGIHTDFANKEKIADLLLFRSTKSGNDAFVTLKDYVEAMPSDQDEIYYLTGEKVEDIQHSPYLEVFKSRGQEVIFMTDPVDEWVVQGLNEYAGKSLKAVDKGDVSTDDAAEKAREKNQETFKSLLESLNAKLDEVKDVRISTRLTDSASCLVSDDGDMGAHMERLMRKMGRDGDMPESKRILELNASHAAVASLQALYDRNSDDPRIEVFGRLLYEQAVIAEGSRIQDPTAFAQRINDLMVKDLGDSAS